MHIHSYPMTTEAQAKQQAGEITAMCACFHLRQASRVVTQLYDETLRPTGILGTQLPLLVALRLHGELTVHGLAKALVMDRTTLTRNLKPIEREGLIRIGTGEDRRERIVHLTAKGRRRLDRAVPLWKKAQSQVVRAVGRDGFERLLSDLGELVEETRQE